VAGLGLALIVARDFDRQRRGRTWATTRGGWAVRLLAIATAMATGAVAALVAIPTIQPHFFRGFCWVLEPEIVGMVMLGFGAFSAGLAARALAPHSVA
jgi:hypothetical protein